jgi:hypothetical protein
MFMTTGDQELASSVAGRIVEAREFRDALIRRRRALARAMEHGMARPEPLEHAVELKALDCAIEGAGRRYDTAWAQQATPTVLDDLPHLSMARSE